MRKILLGLCALFLTGFSFAVHAESLAKEYFGHVNSPSAGSASPIGSYARGCLAGAEILPETGPTWQTMRLSRNRNYGHPLLIDFIRDLSAFAAQQPGVKGLFIGDMSQPRGGPMLSGHASHQIGLDVDIWDLLPTRLDLSANERENISSISLVTDNLLQVNGNFTQAHFNILKQAAQDSRVARIFITPAVKLEMCKIAQGDRSWLGKLRPWWGHNYHFHVRLKCPAGATNCQNQDPVPAGDGCDQAQEFYNMYIAKSTPVPDDGDPDDSGDPVVKTLSWLPAQCASLVGQ